MSREKIIDLCRIAGIVVAFGESLLDPSVDLIFLGALG